MVLGLSHLWEQVLLHLMQTLKKLFYAAATSRFHIDCILIDSASGYRPESSICLYLSDVIFVLFRWGKQSFVGTTRMIEFLKATKKRFYAVASATPAPNTNGRKHKQKWNKEVYERKNECEICELIGECDSLKWEEEVFWLAKRNAVRKVKTRTALSYQRIADLIDRELME